MAIVSRLDRRTRFRGGQREGCSTKKFQERVWLAASFSMTLPTFPSTHAWFAQNWKSEEIMSKWSKGACLTSTPHFPFLTKPRFSRIHCFSSHFLGKRDPSHLDLSCFPYHSSGVSRPHGQGQSGDDLECQVETLLSLSLGHGWESMWLRGLWADLKCSGYNRSLNRQTD